MPKVPERVFSLLQWNKLHFRLLGLKGKMPKQGVHSARQNSEHVTSDIIVRKIYDKVKRCGDYFKFTLQVDDELNPFND